jgi:hypothetical protein
MVAGDERDQALNKPNAGKSNIQKCVPLHRKVPQIHYTLVIFCNKDISKNKMHTSSMKMIDGLVSRAI